MDDASEAVEKGAIVAWKEAPEKEPFVGEVTDRAGTLESLQGGNDGGIQMTANRSLSVVTLERVEEEDDDEDSLPSLDEDFEKGKAVDDSSRARRDAESAPSSHHQDTNDQSVCRVCRDSTAATVVDDVITLGCACLLDWGRMHRRCAETWFQAKGNRECELCGEIARNVQLPQFMDDDRRAFIEERIITIEIGRGQFSGLMDEILDYFCSTDVWSRINLIWCNMATGVICTFLLGALLCLMARIVFRIVYK